MPRGAYYTDLVPTSVVLHWHPPAPVRCALQVDGGLGCSSRVLSLCGLLFLESTLDSQY
jgi:hypothetical protein